MALEDPAYPRMPLECPLDVDVEGTLVSQDYSAASAEASDDSDAPSSLSYWERLADVRDGTGYAVVYVAGQHGTPCYIVKGVSSHRDITQQPSEPSAGSSRHAVASVLGRFLQESANDG